MGELLEKLGLGLADIIFHTVNLVLLIVALYFLLYKPISKIISDRQAKINEVFETNESLTKQAEEMKASYDKLLVDTKQEAARVAEEAQEHAKAKAREIIEEAKTQAEAIITAAEKECIVERMRMSNDLRAHTADMVIEIATAVLQREVSSADNRRIIDELLQNWETL